MSEGIVLAVGAKAISGARALICALALAVALTGCAPIVNALRPSPTPTEVAEPEEEGDSAPVGFTDDGEAFAHEWVTNGSAAPTSPLSNGPDLVVNCAAEQGQSCVQLHVFARLSCGASVVVRADALRDDVVVSSGIGTMGPLKQGQTGLVEVVFSDPLPGGDILEVHDIHCVTG